jgi:hypothetical protein
MVQLEKKNKKTLPLGIQCICRPDSNGVVQTQFRVQVRRKGFVVDKLLSSLDDAVHLLARTKTPEGRLSVLSEIAEEKAAANRKRCPIPQLEIDKTSFSVVTKESNTMEFKETFQRKSIGKYSKTLAAMGNNKGGYIVFGITDKPRFLKGMSDEQIEDFDSFDPKDLGKFFEGCFQPSLEWASGILKVNGKNIAYFHVSRAFIKPVICTRQDDDLREGGVFFRYSAESRLIKADTLHELLQKEKERFAAELLKELKKLRK